MCPNTNMICPKAFFNIKRKNTTKKRLHIVTLIIIISIKIESLPTSHEVCYINKSTSIDAKFHIRLFLRKLNYDRKNYQQKNRKGWSILMVCLLCLRISGFPVIFTEAEVHLNKNLNKKQI
jgi:hypothetical protein